MFAARCGKSEMFAYSFKCCIIATEKAVPYFRDEYKILKCNIFNAISRHFKRNNSLLFLTPMLVFYSKRT